MDYYFLWFAGLELSLIVNSSILVYRGEIYNSTIEFSIQMILYYNWLPGYFGIEVFPNLTLNHLLYYTHIAMVDLLA